jgi:hypothetical protein
MTELFKSNCDINFPDSDGNTPLFQATKNHKSGSVSILLRNGAEPDIVNKWGNSPLSIALENFSHHCAELLVDSGASVNVRIKSVYLQRQLPSYVKDTISPLLFVLLTSPAPFNVATSLIKAGALPETIPEDLTYTLLNRPGISVDFVKLLLSLGFKLRTEKWTKEQFEKPGLSEKCKSILDVIQESNNETLSLQSLARITIRKCVVENKSIRGHLRKKLDTIELPKSILCFLKLDL